MIAFCMILRHEVQLQKQQYFSSTFPPCYPSFIESGQGPTKDYLQLLHFFFRCARDLVMQILQQLTINQVQLLIQDNFINRPMTLPLLSILLLLILHTHQDTTKFGLLTVTHSRDGDFSVLEKYLEKYAETECYTQYISEINLVWNNEVSPESTSILKRKQHWKIPVYFYRTTFNSMDHRYRLPKQSAAQLLYSLDDDIIVDCQTFKLTFQEYNRVGNGRLGRIVTNQVRGFKFQPSAIQSKEFSYQGHPQSLFFSISQPGAAFIPRHYLELYYLKLNELVELRKQILDVKNCDDIFFYAFVLYFYPELPAVYLRGQKGYKNTDPKVGQSRVRNVYPIRSKCIDDISKALGFNPLRYYSKNSRTYLDNWSYGNLKTILQQKIRGFNEVLYEQPMERDDEQNAANQGEQNTQQQIKKQAQQPTQKTEHKQNKKIEKEVGKEAEKNKAAQKIKPKSTKIEAAQNKDKNLQNISKTVQNAIIDNKPRQTIPPLSNQQQTHYFEMSPQREILLYIILITFLAIICLRLYKHNCDKRKHYRIRVAQQEESHSTSIKLPDRY